MNTDSHDSFRLFSNLSMEAVFKAGGSRDLGGVFESMWL